MSDEQVLARAPKPVSRSGTVILDRFRAASRIVGISSEMTAHTRSREEAAVKMQAVWRGWSTRQPSALIEPTTLLKVVRHLLKERTGFRDLMRQLIVVTSFVIVLLMQRDVASAARVESALSNAIATVSRKQNQVRSVDDAYNWARIAYDDWYNFDKGLNAADSTAQQLARYGITPGYTPTMDDCAPLLYLTQSCEAASGAQPEPEPAAEPEPEPSGRRLTGGAASEGSTMQTPSAYAMARVEMMNGAATAAGRRLTGRSSGGSRGGSSGASRNSAGVGSDDGGASTEPTESDDGEASPEPQWEDWTTAADGTIPDACRRVAVIEEERRKRRECHGVADAPSVLNSSMLGGNLYRGPNRFVGAMLIVQQRRCVVPCAIGRLEAETMIDPICYGAADTAPIAPNTVIWHEYSKRADGYAPFAAWTMVPLCMQMMIML